MAINGVSVNNTNEEHINYDAVENRISSADYNKTTNVLTFRDEEGTQKFNVEIEQDTLELDTTLAKTGYAADAKAVGDEIDRVENAIPSIDSTLSVNGDAADAGATGALIVNAMNQVAEGFNDAIEEWIEDHPETTTVEDGSITVSKFASSVVDDTLTGEGHPADAKATGDAINAEVAARQNAVSAESRARQNADTALNAQINNLMAAVGSPLVASTASAMTDTSKIYVYVGSESGYTNGNWYYYNGSAWTSGGVYNESALETDPTLTVSGAASDAKVTGDEISNLKSGMANSDLFNVLSFLSYHKPLYPTNGVQFTYIDIAKYSIVGTSTNAIAFDFFNSMTELPDGIETNKTYKLYVDGVQNLEVRVFFSTNGTSWDVQQTAITFSGVYNVDVPASATGMLFRIYIASGKTVDTVLSASMYSQTSRTVDLVTDVINESINGVYPNKIDTIGDIRITDSGWTFSPGSGTRARTNANNTYHLYEGDVIKNTNPSLIRMYIGYRGSTGNYYYAGWLQEDFTIPFECDCVILLSYVTESAISTAEELAQYVYVVDCDHAVAEISKDNTELTAVVKSVNHQGYNHLAPNQSLPAYRLSKKYGFTMVECDVLKTSDGVYVLNHDNDISRTGTFYDITGNTPTKVTTETLISNLTYQQLIANYDIRKSLNDKYTGTKIARFDDFILLCKHLGLHAYVELKTGGTADTQALHDIVKNYGMLKNVTWISSLINYLNQMKVYDGSVRLGYVVQNVTAETIAEAQTVKTANNEVFMDANFSNLTTESVDLCINSGMELEAWIVNTNTAMTSLNPYVTRITGDRLKYSDVFGNT